jgi:hypothetical protein
MKSFNYIKILNDNIFKNMNILENLDLRVSFINEIKPEAFYGLNSLESGNVTIADKESGANK